VLTQWAPNWERNGWTKKGGIKNLDIVQKLYKVFLESNAKLIWVRGHVGTELNELADEWANKARKEKLREPTRIDN
jgi:ribonuclease HI